MQRGGSSAAGCPLDASGQAALDLGKLGFGGELASLGDDLAAGSSSRVDDSNVSPSAGSQDAAPELMGTVVGRCSVVSVEGSANELACGRLDDVGVVEDAAGALASSSPGPFDEVGQHELALPPCHRHDVLEAQLQDLGARRQVHILQTPQLAWERRGRHRLRAVSTTARPSLLRSGPHRTWGEQTEKPRIKLLRVNLASRIQEPRTL